jgi:hypothetical protein
MVVDLQKLVKEVQALKNKKQKKEKEKSILKQKVTSKQVVKTNKSTIVIKNNQPAEYVPVYFTAELNKEKRNLFFD